MLQLFTKHRDHHKKHEKHKKKVKDEIGRKKEKYFLKSGNCRAGIPRGGDFRSLGEGESVRGDFKIWGDKLILYILELQIKSKKKV